MHVCQHDLMRRTMQRQRTEVVAQATLGGVEDVHPGGGVQRCGPIQRGGAPGQPPRAEVPDLAVDHHLQPCRTRDV